MSYLDDNYYARRVSEALVENKIKIPEFYNWFDPKQVINTDITSGHLKTTKWEAFVQDTPTAVSNGTNVVSNIQFRSVTTQTSFLWLQYTFNHIRRGAEEKYVKNGYMGDSNSNILPFKEAYIKAHSLIDRIRSTFFLLGYISINKDGKYQKILLNDTKGKPNMFGLLNTPNQVVKNIISSNANSPDKILEAFKEGLAEMNLEEYAYSPIMVLMDNQTSLKLNAYDNNGNKIAYKDMLIKDLASINNGNKTTIRTTPLLKDKIIIFSLQPELLLINEGVPPIINEFVEKRPNDMETSYIDFVIGSTMALDNTILVINIGDV
ncbi:hypothetical protein F0310_05300 (plasmid) [Borrelia sp. A-FGy1]|uniref:hypothetical protein n=1 Tax=Borrelia sp. A-FGy1 TaxID=2608247 RepID=UPI0015F3717C|nr:hypothetical protein [Borrelia sp. A-FGy1]QMU99831.1 hypothetical protein F0310_05300 [Borrelia sp. A-FGy1]